MQFFSNTTLENQVCRPKSGINLYPFGSTMTGRTFSSEKYRFGFNGKENDNEVKGQGAQQDYGMRIYDPRLGKFLSVDPLFKSFPWNSTYAFAENDVIRSVDLDGLEKHVVHITPQKNGTKQVIIQAVEVNKLAQENSIPGHDDFLVFRLQHNADGTTTNLSSNALSSAESKIYESRTAVENANPQFKTKQGEKGISFKDQGGVFMQAKGIVGTPDKAPERKAPKLILDPQPLGNNVLFTDGNLTPDADGILRNFAKQINGNAKNVGGVTINANIGETSVTPTSFSSNAYQNIKLKLTEFGVKESLIKAGDIGPKPLNSRETPTNASIDIDPK
jgi:RHS repeat-associated protein